MYLETLLNRELWKPRQFLFFFPACFFFNVFFSSGCECCFFFEIYTPPWNMTYFLQVDAWFRWNVIFRGVCPFNRLEKRLSLDSSFYFPWNLGTRKVLAAKGNLASTYSGPISAYVVVRTFAQKLSWMPLARKMSCVSTGRTWERKKVRLFVEVVVFFKHISLN